MITPSDIIIDPEFRDLCPPLQPSEIDLLESSLRSSGLISPLIVWKHEGQYLLVDGHNRFTLWQAHEGFDEDFEFKTHELFLGGREGAKNFIIENQLGRRNLAPDAASILRGKLYISEKKSLGGDRKSPEISKAQNDP